MWWKRIKELEEAIAKIKEENEKLNRQLIDPYGPWAKIRLIPISYSNFYDKIFSGFMYKSREDFRAQMMDLYDKFKHADTTKEAKEYLMAMDEVVEDHINFVEALPDQVTHTPIKMLKILEGNTSETTENIKEISEDSIDPVPSEVGITNRSK